MIRCVERYVECPAPRPPLPRPVLWVCTALLSLPPLWGLLASGLCSACLCVLLYSLTSTLQQDGAVGLLVSLPLLVALLGLGSHHYLKHSAKKRVDKARSKVTALPPHPSLHKTTAA